MALPHFLGSDLLPSDGAASAASVRESWFHPSSRNPKDARAASVFSGRESQIPPISYNSKAAPSHISTDPHLPSGPSGPEALFQDDLCIPLGRVKSHNSDGRLGPDLPDRDASSFERNLAFLHPNRIRASAGVQPDVGVDINSGHLQMAKGLKGKVNPEPIMSGGNASLSHSYADVLNNRNPRLNLNGDSSMDNSCLGRILKKGSSYHVEADPTTLAERLAIGKNSLIARIVLPKGEKPWKLKDLAC